jgi:hypothetical protein
VKCFAAVPARYDDNAPHIAKMESRINTLARPNAAKRATPRE